MYNSAVMYYLKYVGHTYLRQVCSNLVEEILAKKASCDIRSEVRRDEYFNLLLYCQQFLDCVFNSHSFFPTQIQYILYLLRQKVTQKFDEANCVTAVNGFLFLRFIVPSIKNPRDAGLTEAEIPVQEQKTFDLIATVVQKVANMQVFREGDALTALNRFIQDNHPHATKFYEKVSSPLAKEDLRKSFRKSVRKPETPLDPKIATDCAFLVSHLSTPGVQKAFKEKEANNPVVEALLREVEGLNVLMSSAKRASE